MACAGFEEVAATAEFLDFNAKMIERADEKRFKLGVGILFPDGIDQRNGEIGFVRVEFEQAVVAFLKTLPDFLVLVGGVGDELCQLGFVERVGKRSQSLRKHRREGRSAVGIFLKRVEAFVIPAGVNLLGSAFAERHMDVDRGGLPDAVEPADALLQKLGIFRQIVKNEVVGKLEISTLATDLRADQEPRAILLGKVGGIAIALEQREALVKNGGRDFDRFLKFLHQADRCVGRGANQQDFLFLEALEEIDKPSQTISGRCQRGEMGLAFREA